MSIETNALTPPRLSVSESRFLVGVGFIIALVAGLIFRIVGQLVLDPSQPSIVAGVFVFTIPVMWLLAVAIFRWRGHTGGARREAAALLVIPGMLIDAISTALFSVVYPNMEPTAGTLFGGLLLLSYATVLVAGFVSR